MTSQPKPIDWYARKYTEKFNMALVPIEPGRKFPRTSDWGNNVITDPDQAGEYYSQNADWNMGVALGPSRMCSLDIDDTECFRMILEEFGVPVEELDDFPTIQGASKGTRIMFRVPEGVELPYCKLTWPTREDPKRHFTVMELRAATDGKQRQDVLPPSIHPDTQQPYRWINQPPQGDWPEPPGWLLAVWSAWGNFKDQFRATCPWLPKPVYNNPPRKTRHKPAGGRGIIQRYNDDHDIDEHLTRYGYKRKGVKRYLSPHSSTKLPGVVLFPNSNKAWIHHASDPLCSDESGSPVGPFDLFCEYEHRGDASSACRALKPEYGSSQVVENPQPTEVDNVEPIAPPADRTPAVQAVDYVSPLPYSNDNGKPIKHAENLRAICQRLGVIVRYNEIRKEEEILIPNKAFTRDNEANASLAWLKSECSRFRMSAEAVKEFVVLLADENQYNPVQSWVQSRPWDGKDRLQELYDTVRCVNDEPGSGERKLKETVIRRWMLSAIEAAFNPNGVSAQGMLVFQGAQGIGKTEWLKSLAPSDMDLIKDGLLLRPDDKDSVLQATSYWIVEIGELDSTFRRSDIAQLKAFITQDLDVLRRPYAPRESRFSRRTVFFGSVNPREYLHDPTGNRRYWTVECEHVNAHHGINMQQVWAQLFDIWMKGERHFPTTDEWYLINANNSEYMAADPIEERVLSGYDWTQINASNRWMTATEVLQELGIERPTKAETTTAGNLIRDMNQGQSKRVGGRRVLRVPVSRRSNYDQ